MNNAKNKSWDSKLFRRILVVSKPHFKLLLYGILLKEMFACI
jgi:hypothetical protein